MGLDLRSELPALIPKAIAWAEERAAEIASTGFPLGQSGLSLARRVGVVRPELIRISMVDWLPLPSDPNLHSAALATGFLGHEMVGLTLHYGIYICYDHDTVRLLSHEFRHVYQYEQLGSIAEYLPVYLRQVVDFGYTKAPFEIDARTNEIQTWE